VATTIDFRKEASGMGEYTTFVCRECGYTADNVRWGVSANDPRKRFMPAVCVQCKEITSVDLTGADIMVDEFHCSACDCQLFFLEKAQSYVCPKCKAKDMQLIQGGEYW
jgi:Zn finger protein HypA/HybF involved in hydrogenase expression